VKTLAVAGTFADFKIVRGRKCAQIVVEVPLEHADAALRTLGGLPNPASERWVGIAPLNGDPQKVGISDEKVGTSENVPTPDKRKWDDLPPSQQAAIRCGEPEFQRFAEVVAADLGWRGDAAEIVRRYCKVASRADLNTNERAEDRWRTFEADYWAWQRDPRRAA
jgi:hypothetical protein